MTKAEANARTLHLVQEALYFAKMAVAVASTHAGHTTTDVPEASEYKELLHDVYDLEGAIQKLLRKVSKAKDKADGY